MTQRLLAAALVAGLTACATAKPPAGTTTADAEPSMMWVHTDTLAPEKVAAFVQARKEWLEVLRAAHTTDARGTFVQVGDRAFVTFHPLRDLCELDALRARRVALSKTVPESAGDRYDQGSDSALVPPHHTEIWSREPDLDYLPAGAPADLLHAACGEMVVEEIRPNPEHGGKEYGEVWEEIRKALAQAHDPRSHVAYRSTYGSGKLVRFWLAESTDALARAPSLEASLAKTLGAEAAHTLVQRLDACVVSRETFPITLRSDLSSPE